MSLQPAEISWSADGRPISSLYDDVYFSKEGGLQETEYVFLRGNCLPERWSSCRSFTIGELGFGTALNFLAAWRLWEETKPARGGLLHYLSFEKHPLDRSALEQALRLWPMLFPFAARLLESYPPLAPGFHRLQFPESRVALTLIYGDARERLPQLRAAVDAWFFDGFAPRKNPELWSRELFAAAAAVSAPGASFSTFSAAQMVRENLSAAGFNPHTVKGFGSKRHMLCGNLAGTSAPRNQPRTAIVIGCGVAGAAAAAALCSRGLEVTILERGAEPAWGASGNSSAVVMPYPTQAETPGSRFYLSCYLHARREIARLQTATGKPAGRWCGVLRLATNARLERLTASLSGGELPFDLGVVLTAEEIAERFAIQVRAPGLYFPAAGWIRPGELIGALLASAGEQLVAKFNSGASVLERSGSKWLALDEGGDPAANGDIVVVANGPDCTRLGGLESLPVHAVRGQLSHIRAPLSLPLVVCYDGYVIPEGDDSYLLGATYEHHAVNREVDPRFHHELVARLGASIDGIDIGRITVTGGRAAFRATTPDRLPLVGAFSPEQHPGLYLSVGHGSRGMISCMLAAEILAAEAAGEPAPLEAELLDAVSPVRFA